MAHRQQNSLADAISGSKAPYFKPTGLLTIFITNDDPVHKKHIKNDFIDGINVSGGIPQNADFLVDINGNKYTPGAKAQRYVGKIDLDYYLPDGKLNPNFGQIDAKHGFINNRFTLSDFTGIQQATSVGTYQKTGGPEDKSAYELIKNHPNFLAASNVQMLKTFHWANENHIPHEDVLKALKKNNSVFAEQYEKIVKKNPDTSKIITEDNQFPDVASIVKENEKEINDVLEEDVGNGEGIETRVREQEDGVIVENTGGISGTEVEKLIDFFEEAPKNMKSSFESSLVGGIISLKYPHDLLAGGDGEEGQDHIVIEMFQYQSPQSTILGVKKGEKAKPSISGYGLRRNTVTKEYIGAVRMPVPNNLSISNGVSWGDSKLNPLEASAMGAAFQTAREATSGDILGSINSVFGNLGTAIEQIRAGTLSAGAPANIALSAVASQFALGRIGINVDANQFIGRGVGSIINPNLELLFNAPKLRNFSFQFNFAPNDELDASIMRKIQRFFKQGMSPVRNNANLIFLGSPNVFRIRYRTKERDRIKGLPMYKICALTTCDINYTPDNVYQAYEDEAAGSSPVRTVMTLNFTELTPVFNNDYNSEFEQEINNDEDSLFSDEFGNNSGEGAFSPITEEDTGF